MVQKVRGAFDDETRSSCAKCNALERALSREPPHADLELTGSTATLTGSREEYLCRVCGVRMQRFVAKQTFPAPSDVWRIV